MAWKLVHFVPLSHGNYGFFDRQRDLFPGWTHAFDDGANWALLDPLASRRRFDQELDHVRRAMFPIGHAPPDTREMTVRQPFVTDASGHRKFMLRFDCSGFEPDEITVKTIDQKLLVHAKHVEESPGRKIHNEFTREYDLPENVDPNTVRSTLSKDGVLQVEAPAPESIEEPPKENLVPIEVLEDKPEDEITENGPKAGNPENEPKPKEPESEQKYAVMEGEEKLDVMETEPKTEASENEQKAEA